MKKITLTFALVMSLNVFAEVRKELDEPTEKACFEEMKKLGCVKNGVEVNGCADQRQGSFSETCKAMLKERKPRS